MKILVFDTETTGLPKDWNLPAFKSPGNWAHLVSISWAIIDSTSNNVMKSHSYIVRPENWTITDESSRIHGITHSQALEFGTPLRYIMEQFNGERFDMMVAHNMNFDLNVVMNAILWDLNIQFGGFKQPKFCTMTASTNICKLPGKYGYKFPKLKELYQCVLGQPPKADYLHNSLYDTLYLCEIIQKSDKIRILMGIPIHPSNNNANQAV